MTTITTAAGGQAPSQASDTLVVHPGVAGPVGTTAVTKLSLAWYEAFPHLAAAKWTVQVDPPFALTPPVTVVAGGPIAEGGFATVIQRYRAIGY